LSATRFAKETRLAQNKPPAKIYHPQGKNSLHVNLDFYYYRPPVSGIDQTYNDSVYSKTVLFAREKFDLCAFGQ
jgi:hypothetical protein